jgi:hypothetical protein
VNRSGTINPSSMAVERVLVLALAGVVLASLLAASVAEEAQTGSAVTLVTHVKAGVRVAQKGARKARRRSRPLLTRLQAASDAMRPRSAVEAVGVGAPARALERVPCRGLGSERSPGLAVAAGARPSVVAVAAAVAVGAATERARQRRTRAARRPRA